MRRATLAAVAVVAITVTPLGADVPRRYTVTEGDTLTEIARALDVPGGMTRLAYVNRRTVAHPDVIVVGQQLVLPERDGKRIIYVPQRPMVGASRSYMEASPPIVATNVGGSSNPYVDPWGCEAETAQDWNGTTYWGKYQFDRQTWEAHGGDPAEFGSASEAEQDRVAANVTYDAWPNC